MSDNATASFADPGAFLDFARRDSYWEDHARLLEREITSMREYIHRLHREDERISHDDLVLLAARQQAREMKAIAEAWKRLAIQYGTETTAERTKRYTVRGTIEVAVDLLHDNASEHLGYACVELARKLAAQLKRPRSTPVSPPVGAQDSPRDTTAHVPLSDTPPHHPSPPEP